MRLRHKIFLSAGLAVTLMLIVAGVFISGRLESVALEQSGRNLDRVARAIDLLAEARFQQRRAALTEWARSSAYAEPTPNFPHSQDDASVEGSPSHDFLLSYSPSGELLSSTPAMTEVSPSLLVDVGPTLAAFDGAASHGLWNLEGRFFEVIAVPVPTRSAGPGVLVAGDRIGDVVTDIQAITGAEVILLAGDEVIESTLPIENVDAVLGEWGAGDPDQNILTVQGERYLVGSHEVSTDLGEGACRHLILQPIAEILEPSRAAVRELAMLGLVAWFGLFVIAALGSRSVTLPLSRLTRAMAGMADRGLACADFPSCGGGYEVKVLEETFRRLARRLGHAREAREQSYREAIAAVVVALDARDHGTYGHSLRVASFAKLLAERSGFPSSQMASVEWGALLHDVGKIAVPDPILQKPGQLDEDEWKIMRRHPEWGRNIVSRVAFLHPALPVVTSHHEDWDGNGYPEGLAGEHIPVEARIFAIVDTYDAITSNRPYRKGRSHDEAIAELQRVAGKQLDPKLVAAFCTLSADELADARRAVDETLGSEIDGASLLYADSPLDASPASRAASGPH